MSAVRAAPAALAGGASAGVILAAFSALAYGLNIPAARLATLQGVGAIDLMLCRTFVLVPLVGTVLVLTGRSFRMPALQARGVLALGIASTGTAFCYLSAVAHIPAPLAAILFYTYPLWIMLLSPLVERRPLPRRRLAVFALAFVGLVMALGPGFDGLDPRGVLFAFAASGFCAWLFFTAARLRGDPVQTFFWTQAIVATLSTLAALTVLQPSPPERLLAAGVPILFTVIGFIIGFALQLLAARRISAATAGLLYLLEPVATVIAAALLLGETLAPLQLAGVGLVLAALAGDIVAGRERRTDAGTSAA